MADRLWLRCYDHEYEHWAKLAGGKSNLPDWIRNACSNQKNTVFVADELHAEVIDQARGRPKSALPTKVWVRCKQEDHAEWKASAMRGNISLSSWARAACIRQARRS